MATGTYAVVVSLGGVSINQQLKKTADHPNPYEEITLPAGNAGTLTTRTDDNTGVATLSTGHGIVSADKVDVYWTGGRRYGMVATVDTNAVTVDGGAGDNLPAATTALVVTEQKQINTAIDGDALVLIGILAGQRCHLDLQDAAGASVVTNGIDLVGDEPYAWHNTCGIANPFAGNPITKTMASNGTATETTITILALEDSTP
jgi:hypothetical protein